MIAGDSPLELTARAFAESRAGKMKGNGAPHPFHSPLPQGEGKTATTTAGPEAWVPTR